MSSEVFNTHASFDMVTTITTTRIKLFQENQGKIWGKGNGWLPWYIGI